MGQPQPFLADLKRSTAQHAIRQIDGMNENPFEVARGVQHGLANEVEIPVLEFAGLELPKGNLELAAAERLARPRYLIYDFKNPRTFEFRQSFPECESEKLIGRCPARGANRHFVHVRASQFRPAQESDGCRRICQQFLDPRLLQMKLARTAVSRLCPSKRFPGDCCHMLVLQCSSK